MDAERIAQIRRIRRRAAEKGKPSGPGEVIMLCDDILEMHKENRLWDQKWKRRLKHELRKTGTPEKLSAVGAITGLRCGACGNAAHVPGGGPLGLGCDWDELDARQADGQVCECNQVFDTHENALQHAASGGKGHQLKWGSWVEQYPELTF